MAEIPTAYCPAKSIVAKDSGSKFLAASNFLRLAATPLFAIMALITGIHGGSMPSALCSFASDASPLTGMVPMYVLMSLFHSPPWLKLISGQ
jgi:hypothetical protein